MLWYILLGHSNIKSSIFLPILVIKVIKMTHQYPPRMKKKQNVQFIIYLPVKLTLGSKMIYWCCNLIGYSLVQDGRWPFSSKVHITGQYFDKKYTDFRPFGHLCVLFINLLTCQCFFWKYGTDKQTLGCGECFDILSSHSQGNKLIKMTHLGLGVISWSYQFTTNLKVILHWWPMFLIWS